MPALAASEHSRGVVRIDGVSHQCEQLVDVASDGSATLLCTNRRERVCTLRTYGPDGEERTRTDGVPGQCKRYVPRARGGGYIFTHGPDNLRLAITALDAGGHAGATLALDSNHWVYLTGTRLAEDDGLFISIVFRDDLVFNKRRLAHAGYFLGAVLRLPGSLDEISWTHIFRAKETGVVAVLSPTAETGVVDAIVNFRGVFRAAGSAAQVGSGSYGWGTARVTLDASGKPLAQSDSTIEPDFAVSDAAMLPDGRTAFLTPDATTPSFANLTTVDTSGVRSAKAPQGVLAQHLHRAGERTWLLAWDRPSFDPALPGPWVARTIDDTAPRRELALNGLRDIKSIQYLDVGSRGDRFALIGVTEDPRTRTPVTFLALGSLVANGASIDLSALRVVDHLDLAPGCGGPEISIVEHARQIVAQHREALARCGVVPGASASLHVWGDGGISVFEYKHPSARVQPGKPTTFLTNPSVAACARAVLEPEFACPLRGGNVSLPLIPFE